MRQLKWFWKNWNESVMFLVGIVLFIVAPSFYRLIDATAGSLDLGILQLIPQGYLMTQFILFSSWLSHKFTFPKIHKYLDDTLEQNAVVVTSKWRANLFSFGTYAFYVWVHIQGFKLVA